MIDQKQATFNQIIKKIQQNNNIPSVGDNGTWNATEPKEMSQKEIIKIMSDKTD